jgi:hypothetical protein
MADAVDCCYDSTLQTIQCQDPKINYIHTTCPVFRAMKHGVATAFHQRKEIDEPKTTLALLNLTVNDYFQNHFQ